MGSLKFMYLCIYLLNKERWTLKSREAKKKKKNFKPKIGSIEFANMHLLFTYLLLGVGCCYSALEKIILKNGRILFYLRIISHATLEFMKIT